MAVIAASVLALAVTAGVARQHGWLGQTDSAPILAVGFIREEATPDSQRVGRVLTDMLATNLSRIEGLSVLPENLYSHGSAILTTLQQVAGAAGTAGFVTIAAIGSTAATGTPDAAGLRLAFMAAGVIGLIAVGVSFMVRPKSERTEADLESVGTDESTPTPVAGH